jgi:thioredoxin-related protein
VGCIFFRVLKRFLKNTATIRNELNPNFSVEKFALGDHDPDPYGKDAMVNPDLQIVLQFVAPAAVADFAFQLQNPG